MTESAGEREERLRERAESAGQGHLFEGFGRLASSARARYLDELDRLDFELVGRLAELLATPAPKASLRFEPPEIFPLRRAGPEETRARAARERGEELLRRGEVGFLLVAGGQASRLGYDGPKGAFPVGPVSGRSLFEFHARRLRAARERYGRPMPWYVMTSRANRAATREIFERADWFGLDPDDVRFFEQAMLPALDPSGRVLLAAEGELFLAPNGHGGVLSALEVSGALADARARGIRTFSYFQVDNPLARPADPLFLGLHALAEADMSSKVVEKRSPDEKVGVLGRCDGRLGCIEYSDLPDGLRHARDEDGRLLFRAGNIALHAIELAFVEELTRGGLRLPWHLARKRVRALDASGRAVEREAVKFEAFVFDALARARRSVTQEVERALEFSPVKNASGEDSPASARRDLCKLHAGWVRSAGLPLPAAQAEGEPLVEVDPLIAEDEQEFARRAPLRPELRGAGHLYTR